MWSYCADKYAGAVVEFDDSDEFFRGHFLIKYRETRPKKDMGFTQMG